MPVTLTLCTRAREVQRRRRGAQVSGNSAARTSRVLQASACCQAWQQQCRGQACVSMLRGRPRPSVASVATCRHAGQGAPGVQRERGGARGVGRVGGRAGRVLDRRKLVLAPHLQQRAALGQREAVEDEQLQLDALRAPRLLDMLPDMRHPLHSALRRIHLCAVRRERSAPCSAGLAPSPSPFTQEVCGAVTLHFALACSS